ncbi:MAG: DMT family transporter [Promethearchaeia archaeon]
MESEDLKKGIFFGILGALFIGFQPIVANARPSEIDSYIYAAMTVLVEALIFFPVMLFERNKIKSDFQKGLLNSDEKQSLLFGYKNNILLLIFVGAVFGFGQILFFLGYKLAGAINGSLAQKATVFFSLFFSWLILKEKITKRQIFFSILLFFGLILAVTKGSFDLLRLNQGVLILLILTSLWMLAHTLTKPLFNKKEAIASQIVFIRNFLGAIILFSTYFLFFPLSNISILLNSEYVLWGIAMGSVYGIGLFFWYKTLQYLEVSKASILVSPTPIITAIYAMLFLGEQFTIFHLLGSIIIIFSIIMIVQVKKEEKIAMPIEVS